MGLDLTSAMAATKLRPPAVPLRVVDRGRLSEVLDEAHRDDVPLVLVSAPAGSGKSTLVARWAAAHDTDVAWLQVEDTDADPARFWAAATAAIGRRRPEVAARVAPLVIGSQGSAELVVAALVNELESLEGRLVVVLDDYHLIDDADVHRGVERLLELCPPQLTVVIVTRADPPFRLGRLRVRGRVREIRARDLRFDHDEAALLLGTVAERLGDERLDALCERTEGWAAGLVLASLSLERTGDAARFVETFRGDDQLVAGYLTDELLASIGAHERRRLVEAAVLHRLTGPLLDAVTGTTDGATWLAELASRNQLVIRLDHAGEWYRYHHLFRDLLLLDARRTIGERIPELHRSAAAWFEANGYHAAAVDHLLQAGDRLRAMDLMRYVGPDLLGLGQRKTLRNILDRIAAGGELDAVCSLLSGWDHYLFGRYEVAQHHVERSLATMPPHLDPMLAMPLRINVALGRGDVESALADARRVLAAGDLVARPSELGTAVGATLTWAGLHTEARSALTIALARTTEEGRVTAHTLALVALSILELYGDDRDATLAAAERAIASARTHGLDSYHGMAPAFAVRAAVTSDVDTARADALHAVTTGRGATTMPGFVLVLSIAGDVALRSGDARGAAHLDEARELLATCAAPGIAAELHERIAARHGRAARATAPATALVEQLTEKELAALRYLPSTLSLREIASELYVSLNTVKTHTAGIYRKLLVANRHDAVRTARELRLL